MADVSYESLQSKIASQRQIIKQRKIAGEKGIESIRKVHPRTPPGVYFGQVQPQIKTIKGRLVELESAEKQLSEQKTLLAEKKAEGYKIRETGEGEIELYKEVYTPGETVRIGTRPTSIMVHWINPKTGKTGRFQGRQSQIADYERQLGATGRHVTKVTTIGGGEPIYKEKEGFWTTKDVILWEGPPIVKEPIKTMKEISFYTGLYEKIPETSILKKKLPTPTKFAEARGLPSDVFKEWQETKVTTTTREMTQAEIKDLLSKMTKEERITWYKEHAEFGVEGEEKKPWSEIKKQYPDWALTVKGTEAVVLTPETDTGTLFKAMEREYQKSPGIAGVIRAATIPFLSALRFETIVAGLKQGGPLSGGILGVQPRIGRGAAVETLKWEYSMKDQPPLEKWVGVQRPAYETVILPFVGGAIFGKGISILSKFTSGFAKAHPVISGATRITTKVAIGGLVGYAYAEPTVGYAIGGMTTEQYVARIGKLTTQLAFFGFGAKWATAPRQPILKKEFLIRYEKGETVAVAQRKYIDFLGKPRYYGKPVVGVKPEPLFVKTLDPYLAYAKVTRYGVAGVTPTVVGRPPMPTTVVVRPTVALVPKVVPDIVRYDPFRPITGRIDYGVKPLERIELERVDWRIQGRIDSLIRQERETYLEKQYEETMRRAGEKLGITFRPPKPKVDVLKIEKLDPYLGYARVFKYGVLGVTPTVVGKPPVPTALILRPTAMIVPRTFKDILLYDPFRPITGRIDYGLKPLELELDGIRKRLEARNIREFYERQDELREIRYEETLRKAAEKLEFTFKPKPPKIQTLRVDVLDPYLGYTRVSKYGVVGVTPTVVGKPPVPGVGVYTGRQPILRPISALTIWDWLTYTVKPEVPTEPIFKIFPKLMKPLRYTLKDIIKEPKIEPGVTVTRDGQILIQKKVVEARPIFRKKLVRPERVFDPYDVYGETEFVRNEIIESFGKLTGKPVAPAVMQRDMLLMFPVLKAAPMVKEERLPRTVVDVAKDVKQMQLQFPVTKVGRGLLFDTLQTQYQTQIQEQAQMQMQEFATATIQEQMQFQSQAQMLDVKSMQKLFQEQVTVTIKPPKPVPFILPDTPYKLFGHTIGQGYNVKIKERHIVKGKKIKEPRFIRVNKRPLSLRDAEALRGMVLDNSAAASGKIVPVNAMAQEPIIKLKPFEDIQHKFYLKDDILIEKPKHRIDTKGEVKGISALGWYAERTTKATKKKPVSRPRAKEVRERDMFDMGMDDMLIDMNKIFKGVFDFGF